MALVVAVGFGEGKCYNSKRSLFIVRTIKMDARLFRTTIVSSMVKGGGLLLVVASASLGLAPIKADAFNFGQLFQPKESADPYTKTASLCDQMGAPSSPASGGGKYGPLGPLLVGCSPQVRSNYAENVPINNSAFDKILQRLEGLKGVDATDYLKKEYPLGFELSEIDACKRYDIHKPSFADLSSTLAIRNVYLCSPRKALLLLEVSEDGRQAIYVLDPYYFNKLYFNNLIYGKGQMADADRAGSRAAWYFTKTSYQGIDQYRWANTLLKRLSDYTSASAKGGAEDLPDKKFGIAVAWCDRQCIDGFSKAAAAKGVGPSFVSPGAWIAQVDGAFVISRVIRSSRADRGCLKPYDFIMTIGNQTVPRSVADLSSYIEAAPGSIDFDVYRLEGGQWTQKALVVRELEWYGSGWNTCPDR